MPMTKASLFLEAKKWIRLHPDWDDAAIAEAAGVKPVEIPDIVVPARREYLQAG